MLGGSVVPSSLILDQSFSFYVINKDFYDDEGNPIILDMVVLDMNDNDVYDILEDEVLVGPPIESGRNIMWGVTVFGIDFFDVGSESELPKPNDVYHVSFNRPYFSSDSILFKVHPEQAPDEDKVDEDMEDIRVVPNPYVVTNTMESAVANWDRNQRRQLMFTNIPAQSKISIFTMSGVLIDVIDVDNAIANRTSLWDLNSEANGTVHWDLRSKEGLEIAAGYYIYHVQSKISGDTKVGKFAIIK